MQCTSRANGKKPIYRGFLCLRAKHVHPDGTRAALPHAFGAALQRQQRTVRARHDAGFRLPSEVVPAFTAHILRGSRHAEQARGFAVKVGAVALLAQAAFGRKRALLKCVWGGFGANRDCQ